MQQAWLTVLGKKTDIATRGTFTELFHDHDALQEFQFSPVHRIVLELNSSIKLSDYLSLTVSEINCIDSMGRTPLSWAAIRSDAESVKTLLKFGANAEVSNRGGVTPTHSSASCNDPAVLKALVDSGVNIAIQDRSGLTPLHWAATYGSVEHLKILRDAGADINALDSYSVTSLCMASMMGKTANAKFLLDNGANIKIADWDGDSPLFTSVLYNQYDVLRLLLERGADIAAKNSRGRTILHVVASRGDATTCKILAKRKWMEVVDTDLRDCDGKLAEELVHERLTVDQEFLEEFCKLIRWTRECLQAKIMGVDLVAPKEEDSGTGSLDYSSDVDSDEEEFWDAEE